MEISKRGCDMEKDSSYTLMPKLNTLEIGSVIKNKEKAT